MEWFPPTWQDTSVRNVLKSHLVRCSEIPVLCMSWWKPEVMLIHPAHPQIFPFPCRS